MATHDRSLTKRNDGMQTDLQRIDEVLTPSADIVETAEAYLLMLDMPGAAKESLSISMEQNVLKVKGTVNPVHPQDGEMLFQEI